MTPPGARGRSFGFLLVLVCVLPVAGLLIAYALGVPIPRLLVVPALSLCMLAGFGVAIRYGRRS